MNPECLSPDDDECSIPGDAPDIPDSQRQVPEVFDIDLGVPFEPYRYGLPEGSPWMQRPNG